MVQGGGLRDQLQAGEAGEGGGKHGSLQGAKASHSRREEAGLTSRREDYFGYKKIINNYFME